ncbi:MAG TPA: hypothetical protein VK066_27440 [Chloroflexota bacterium]|nr:hypothetical protein [Chloroflexota bacterium]
MVRRERSAASHGGPPDGRPGIVGTWFKAPLTPDGKLDEEALRAMLDAAVPKLHAAIDAVRADAGRDLEVQHG